MDEFDLFGPVPTEAERRCDYYLLISWIFLVFVSIDMAIRKTRLRIVLIRCLRRLAMWLRDIKTPRNMAEIQAPVRLQAIENNHPHND